MKRRSVLLCLPLLLAIPAAAQPGPTPPSAGASVSVSRDVLERYVGRYALNGAVATVSLTDDNRLMVRLSGQPAGPPMRTVSATEFVSDTIGVHVFFEGEGPKATRLRSPYAGQEVIGTRLADGADAGPISTLAASDRQDVVAKLGEALRQRYIYPDVADRVAAKLNASLAAGDYDGLSDPADFAARLTTDANSVAHDKHLRVMTNAGMMPPPGARMPLAEGGVVRADKLAGGIGYIEIIGFPPIEPFKQALDRAMASLAGSRALIIDVRRNGGGVPKSVAYLSSFLVGPDVHLNDIVGRVENKNEFIRTAYNSVPTPVSFIGVPVYVLTSGNTFSGGEGFAYEVQAQKRATVIGDVTGGGANPGGMFGLTTSFNVVIPTGRAENPVTKTSWEGRGVKPDVPVPAQEALATALQRAGQKPVDDIGAASLQQVFTPRPQAFAQRTAPRPGAETALRAVLAGYLSGKPNYDVMTQEAADMTRAHLPTLQAEISLLGELQTVKFMGSDEMGGDQFELHFAKGARMMALVLDPAGKIVAVSNAIPLPGAQ